MYQQSTKTLQAAFDRMAKQVPTDLDAGPANLIEYTRSMFKLMLDNHSQNSLPGNKEALSRTKKKMAKEIITELDNLDADLKKEAPPQVQEQAEQLPVTSSLPKSWRELSNWTRMMNGRIVMTTTTMV